MKKNLLPLLLTAVLCLMAGCLALPSGWRPFGSPLDKVEKKQADEATAKDKARKGAQGALHKAENALNQAGDSRPVVVARGFVFEARSLLDQSEGTPSATDLAAWQDLTNRLLSENADIRAGAERQRDADSREIGRISDRLAAATAATARANAKAMDYARESEATADLLRKVYWIALGLGVLWAVGQVLAVVAKLNPAFGLASTVVNGIAAPAVAWAQKRAETGLRKVGQAIADAKAAAPEIATRFVQFLDPHADTDHQKIISTAAGGPTT